MISKNKYLKINNFYKRVDPDRPNWVRLYGRKNYREFLRIITSLDVYDFKGYTIIIRILDRLLGSSVTKRL